MDLKITWRRIFRRVFDILSRLRMFTSSFPVYFLFKAHWHHCAWLLEKHCYSAIPVPKLIFFWFPRSSTRRYTQVLPSQKRRHSGIDAGIQRNGWQT
jgi:hypothetical protein